MSFIDKVKNMVKKKEIKVPGEGLIEEYGDKVVIVPEPDKEPKIDIDDEKKNWVVKLMPDGTKRLAPKYE